jgi:rhodanese-related sulfurtransferase
MPTPPINDLTRQPQFRMGRITPRELSSLISDGESIIIIDVREADEWEIARIPSARLMPLGALPASAATVDRDADIVVYCHHGVRSEAAAHHLLSAGFHRVRNLVGGIDRWSCEVDSSVRRY